MKLPENFAHSYNVIWGQETDCVTQTKLMMGGELSRVK
jgi:hypothetical protein